MLSEQGFYHKWRSYFKRNHKYGPHYPDDYEGDAMMLFVVDDVPPETINTILKANIQDYGVPRSMIHLADDKAYDSLPNFNGLKAVAGTQPPAAPTWQCPFLGTSLAEISVWVCNIPKPSKAVCKSFFAVLDKELYEARGMLRVCKVGDVGEEPQTLLWTGSRITGWLVAYERENWRDDWEDQVWG